MCYAPSAPTATCGPPTSARHSGAANSPGIFYAERMGVPAQQLHPALRGYVASMEHYDVAGFPPGEHLGLPSATVTLVIPLDEPLDLTMPGRPRHRLRSCLAGMHDAPAIIHHDGTQCGLQLSLTPLGLYRLFGLPAGEIGRQAVELADVVGSRAAAALAATASAAPDWPACVRALQNQLVRRLQRTDEHRRAVRPELAWAWNLLAGSGGTARICRLAADVGWSSRYLTQQFTAAVGVTPKTAGRIMRFQRSAALVGRGHDLAGVAARCRYADQAHMTREWRRLAGTTPTRWPYDDVFANVQDARRRGGQDR